MLSILDLKNPTINKYDVFSQELYKKILNIETKTDIITEKNSEFISTFPVSKSSSGIIAELHGKNNKIILIIGKNQSNNPGSIHLKCYDDSGKEPMPDTKINIKIHARGYINAVNVIQYGLLSESDILTYTPPECIYIKPGESLIFEIIDPNIDIHKVKLCIVANIFKIINSPIM